METGSGPGQAALQECLNRLSAFLKGTPVCPVLLKQHTVIFVCAWRLMRWFDEEEVVSD